VDIRQLQYAIALSETLHFGRAAESMHIAQSAFSTQIARLERQIGAQLFDRSANRVALTTAGEAFILRAREILAQIDDASMEARILHSAGQSQLRIGLFYESAGELTPLIVAAFRCAMPDVDLSFHELTMVDQVEALAKGDVDVAFIRSPIADKRIQLLELFAEPRFVGLPAGHPLAGQDTIKTHDLVDEAFVVASPMAPPQWRGYWSFDDLRGGPAHPAWSTGRLPTEATPPAPWRHGQANTGNTSRPSATLPNSWPSLPSMSYQVPFPSRTRRTGRRGQPETQAPRSLRSTCAGSWCP
jgi:DNA-binding transcriptional LysR family regulator